MAYNISLTNGQDLVTVADGTINSDVASITLIGKNFAGYGDFLNENLVHMLENFANTTEPPNPLEGQVWWDTVNKVLKVRNNTGWKSVSSSTASTTAPPNAVIGDLWWDSANGQLKVFSGGTSWVTIGPAYTATQGQTGVIADSIVQTDGAQSHVIVKMMVNNTCIGVMSKDPAFSVNTLPGFSIIKPGVTLSSTGNLAYYGNADNAINLAGVPAANYLRSDQASTTYFPFAIQNSTGLTVGQSADLKLSTSSTSVDISSTVSNKDMTFRVNANNVPSTLLTLSATQGLLAVTPSGSSPATAVATKEYVDNSLLGTGSSVLRRDGSNTISGLIIPDISDTRNFGSASSKFASIYATNFVGLASDSTKFGGLSVGQFVRSDAPSSITTPLVTTSNDGLTLGAAADFKIYVTSTPNAVHLDSTTSGKNMVMSVNVAGVPTQVIGFDGATGLATVLGSPTAVNGIATKAYVDAIAAGGVDLSSVHGNIIPQTTDTYTVGSDPTTGGKKFAAMYATNFYGTASKAKYADLAERYESDAEYLPGTVVELGGTKEITIAADDLSNNVFGVISTDPAYLMNSDAGSDKTHPPVALHGRVPVRIIGAVCKGDRLVSAGNGLARAAQKEEITAFNVIGRALEDKNSTVEGIVLATVKANI